MERLNTSPEIPAETTHEQSPYPKNLYHVSSWNELSGKNVGDTFLLKPGSQKTEGLGVYFSENAPRPHAADGVVRTGEIGAVVVLPVDSPKGWWRTKGTYVRRHNRPRTWHSEGKEIKCTVKEVRDVDGIKYLYVDGQFETSH